jgi:hypothetical protein
MHTKEGTVRISEQVMKHTKGRHLAAAYIVFFFFFVGVGWRGRLHLLIY